MLEASAITTGGKIWTGTKLTWTTLKPSFVPNISSNVQCYVL